VATFVRVDGNPLPLEAVDAYLGAVDWLRGLLGRAEVAAAWPEPSAIAGYTVGGVASHAVHSVLWLEQLLKNVEPVGLRTVTTLEYFGPNRIEGSDDADPFSASLRAAAEAFAQTGPEIVNAACITARDELVGLLTDASVARAVSVVRVPGGQVPLGEYLRTRVLEIVVHGDDVACSVAGMTVVGPPPDSMATCIDVCLELARARAGDLPVLRAFTRRERAEKDVFLVL
jgi:Mycothiol maleylpyruvate isomerase N-terminal domain